jgi:heme/copper-type cytochrome/quinol oxidase subunit 3
MSELASHATGYEAVEAEPPELLGRNLRAAGHLSAGATAFFFLAFVFAYFYLRSLNSAGLWRPKGVDPSLTLGTLAAAAVAVSAVLLRLGLADHRAGRRPEWRLKGSIALAAGIAAIVLQVVEWATQGFGPTDGGYASVYLGWTAFYVLFLAVAVYWLETILATSYRYRRSGGAALEPGHGSGDTYRTAHDIADPLAVVRPGLEALSMYTTFLAALGVLSWVVLYLL